jgi:type VI protein secretion system component VasK
VNRNTKIAIAVVGLAWLAGGLTADHVARKRRRRNNLETLKGFRAAKRDAAKDKAELQHLNAQQRQFLRWSRAQKGRPPKLRNVKRSVALPSVFERMGPGDDFAFFTLKRRKKKGR